MYFFSSNVVSPPYVIYMGEDKHENEDLIKYAFPEDVWFHVDKLSSAHVYLRMRPGENLEDIPENVLVDCVQLVKANSIQGSKMNNLDVVYTLASNLKKTGDMDVGQVSFRKHKEVKKVHVDKKINEIINRLNRTKEEKKPDLKALKEERDAQERQKTRELERERRNAERDAERSRREQAELRSYSSLMSRDKMTTNYEQEDDDDFM